MTGDRRALAASLALAAVLASAFAVRAALPNGQHRDIDFRGIPRDPFAPWPVSNGFDDAAALVVAHHFASDGFAASGFLENRGGAPGVALWNHLFQWCAPREQLAIGPRYRTWSSVWTEGEAEGAVWIDAFALDHDCIYSHYPPFPAWVAGITARAGLEGVLPLRLLAIALNCVFLFLLFLWLRAEVSPGAALVAVAALGTAPAFQTWAEALYYQSFQYAFFAATLVAWRAWLRDRRRRSAALAASSFFLLALSTPELIVFAGLAVTVQSVLDDRGSAAARVRRLAVLALAPVAAQLLHLGLRVRFFGADAVWRDLGRTFAARIVHEYNVLGMQIYRGAVEAYLLPFGLAALAVAAVGTVRVAARAPLARPLALLATFVLGALSFVLLFPGTSSVQGQNMYRHLMPAFALLAALLADAALRAWALLRERASVPRRAVAAAGLLAFGGVAGWIGWRNAVGIADEIAWARSQNLQHDPANQAVRFLDAITWKEWGRTFADPRMLMPVDGARAYEKPDPERVFWVESAAGVRWELWWLEPIDIREIRLLTDAARVPAALERCRWSAFGDGRFEWTAALGLARVTPFTPEGAEPAAPDARWITLSFPARTRGLRLSCDDLPEAMPLHEVEVR